AAAPTEAAASARAASRPAPPATRTPADDAATAPPQAPTPQPATAEPDAEAGAGAEARPAAPLAGQPRCEDGEGAGGTRGWRVYLPPAADLASAEATAARIAAAGFDDFLVLRDGAHRNGIALGMFSTEAGAQRRSAALRGAGFEARCARIPASTPA